MADNEKVKWLRVVRDVIMLLVLMVVGTVLVVIAMYDAEATDGVWLLIMLALLTGGFCFSGCLTPKHRWKHLLCVGIGWWLTSIILTFYGGFSRRYDDIGNMPVVVVVTILFTALWALVPMVVGGALSFLFIKPPKEGPAKPPGEETAETETNG
jgi:hypothetical protein